MIHRRVRGKKPDSAVHALPRGEANGRHGTHNRQRRKCRAQTFQRRHGNRVASDDERPRLPFFHGARNHADRTFGNRESGFFAIREIRRVAQINAGGIRAFFLQIQHIRNSARPAVQKDKINSIFHIFSSRKDFLEPPELFLGQNFVHFGQKNRVLP